MALLKHLHTVGKHRRYVRSMCFKMGIPWQGLVHDLSKYSIKELSIAKYYTGTKSPHAACRELKGYSPSWMHHYHKNKHHWQFWLDIEDWPNNVVPVKMPYKYVIESFCDMVGASKAYNPKSWNESMPWDYYEQKCAGNRLMHKESEYLLAKLLWNLKIHGQKKFIKWYKGAKKYLKENYINGSLEFNDNETSIYFEIRA